jgi:virginiamycin B lyase
VAGKIGKLDPTTGEITEYDLPSPAFEPYELCVDNEDAVWVAGFLSNTLARFDRATGTFVEYPIPTPRSEIRKMTPDPKGGVWFAQSHTDTIGHIMVKR